MDHLSFKVAKPAPTIRPADKYKIATFIVRMVTGLVIVAGILGVFWWGMS
jgi:hypothetical protein